MVGGKLGLRMTTLHEETSNTGNQLSTPVHDEDEEKSDADYSEYDSYQVVRVLKFRKYIGNSLYLNRCLCYVINIFVFYLKKNTYI